MKLSIITPCYNHGQYLDEMFASVHNYDWPFSFEHIIVNDGSTDNITLAKLNELQARSNTRVIHQPNRGLGAARNTAIQYSKGEFILPLDSDNKIDPNIIVEAIYLFDDNKLAVIYTDSLFFDQKVGYNKIQEFEINTLLYDNYIDACALIRASTLKECGGYAIDMPCMGFEDWELWIRLYSFGYCFKYFSKPGYSYRVTKTSMINTIEEKKWHETRDYFFQKFPSLYRDYLKNLEHEVNHYRRIDRMLNKSKMKSIVKLFLGWNNFHIYKRI